jgi:hypothetical protein
MGLDCASGEVRESDSGPVAVIGNDGQIPAQFGQEGVRRIIIACSALSYTGSPGERNK